MADAWPTTRPPPSPGTTAALAEMLDRELEGLDRELAEIEMLVGQARTEAGRHEQKRAKPPSAWPGSARAPLPPSSPRPTPSW